MVEVKNLTVTFPSHNGTPKIALNSVSLTIPDGKIVGLVGESGSGKTTLSRTICGLQKPTSGIVTNHSENKRIAMVFQDAQGSLDPRQTIYSSLREVLITHHITGKDQLDGEIRRLINLVGLPLDVAMRIPRELSGGQCQRISIARAMALRPSLLIGDEPVSALDVSVQARILRLFSSLLDGKNQGGVKSILIITHDLAVVSAVCDYLYVLKTGEIVEEGIPGEVFASPRHPYTQRLLASVPTI